MRDSKMLTLMLTFIVSTVFYAWAKPLGTPVAIIASLFGLAVGWVGSRWIMRRIF